MDVRCDRCETEYELDDAIVTDAGASVQCTTCGHTFIVTRRPSSPLNQVGLTPPGGITDGPGPEVPEWTLSADDGKVHRFRDLNVLQKWIVERKVTRSDQISRSGGPWLSLGDVVELSPFFKVVDEADRARVTTSSSPGMPSMPGMVSAAQSRAASGPVRTSMATPPPVPIDARRPVSEDGPTVPNRRLPGAAEGPSIPQPGIRPPDSRASTPRVATAGRLPGMGGAAATPASRPTPRAPLRTEIVFGPNITAETQALDSDFLQPSRRGRNVAVLLVVLVLAGGGGGYWWWMQQQAGGVSSSAEPPVTPGEGASPSGFVVSPTTASTPPSAPQPPQPPPPSTPPSTQPSGPPSLGGASGRAPDHAAAVPGAGAGVRTGVPAGSKVAGAAGGTGGRGRPPVPVAPVASSSSSSSTSRGAAEAPSPRASSYDRLVADADKLLDRGKSAKADKLYAQALAVRPDGVAALTGAAYVLLDRQRHFKAIETFRRALAIQPTFGPALFGIAESYRARGDNAQALGAYRQYLATTPAGTDAPAARRQIKDLESGGAAAAAPAADRSSSGPPPTDE